ncbi:Hypothetical protein GbCGDNIH9_8589 [Granulibacter bethesdensis]|uniref:Uncharacterized protein n=1 Tax=Granulibacter bethesdensis TaxID=364410 RepID=A0AAC9KAV8_9PROT|nr:Hypothetical protein GbCGDNIH9_8589 [Granulibacter bethesdensis]APH62440.1 Hypothetical protein GbCGDNIH8_8589 [Granulibacter bethesdensis]
MPHRALQRAPFRSLRRSCHWATSRKRNEISLEAGQKGRVFGMGTDRSIQGQAEMRRRPGRKSASRLLPHQPLFNGRK